MISAPQASASPRAPSPRFSRPFLAYSRTDDRPAGPAALAPLDTLRGVWAEGGPLSKHGRAVLTVLVMRADNFTGRVREPTTLPILASSAALSRSTTLRALDELERRGVVERTPHRTPAGDPAPTTYRLLAAGLAALAPPARAGGGDPAGDAPPATPPRGVVSPGNVPPVPPGNEGSVWEAPSSALGSADPDLPRESAPPPPVAEPPALPAEPEAHTRGGAMSTVGEAEELEPKSSAQPRAEAGKREASQASSAPPARPAPMAPSSAPPAPVGGLAAAGLAVLRAQPVLESIASPFLASRLAALAVEAHGAEAEALLVKGLAELAEHAADAAADGAPWPVDRLRRAARTYVRNARPTPGPGRAGRGRGEQAPTPPEPAPVLEPPGPPPMLHGAAPALRALVSALKKGTASPGYARFT